MNQLASIDGRARVYYLLRYLRLTPGIAKPYQTLTLVFRALVRNYVIHVGHITIKCDSFSTL